MDFSVTGPPGFELTRVLQLAAQKGQRLPGLPEFFRCHQAIDFYQSRFDVFVTSKATDFLKAILFLLYYILLVFIFFYIINKSSFGVDVTPSLTSPPTYTTLSELELELLLLVLELELELLLLVTTPYILNQISFAVKLT